MIVVESYQKYPRRIARVFINFIVFTSWQRLLSVPHSAFEVMASLNEDQAEVVNDNGRKLPKVPPKYCESV